MRRGHAGETKTKSSDGAYDAIEIEVPVFNALLELFVGDTSKVGEWASDDLQCDLLGVEDAVASADGFTVSLADVGKDGYVVIALKDFRRRLRADRVRAVGVLAHECLHAVKAVFESRGVPFTPENEEAIAYLQEHLIEEALTRLSSSAPRARKGKGRPARAPRKPRKAGHAE